MKKKFSRKKALVALLLCIFLFPLGIHRFYVGKTGTGITLILLTLLSPLLLPLFAISIWFLIDLIMIATGSFTDKKGFVLKF